MKDNYALYEKEITGRFITERHTVNLRIGIAAVDAQYGLSNVPPDAILSDVYEDGEYGIMSLVFERKRDCV